MEIKLNWLRLKNFKGIKDFTLTANGGNVSVKADNGKGKTTVADAFFWLLFGKDSVGTDSKNIKINPQDEDGKDIHHLQSVVECELLITDSEGVTKPLHLKKMQKEKWVKSRGEEEPKPKGYTNSYWWDEKPVKETEYKQKINELLNEKIFKMITDPFYFSTQIDWKDRRDIVLEICGDATNEQVFASDSSLAKLEKALNGRSIDDYKEIIKDKIKDLKKEKADIPPRIDELTRGLPQEEEDYSAVATEIEGYRDIIAGIDAEMNDANKIIDAFRKKQQELYGFKGQLEKVKSKIDSELGADRKKLVEEKAELLEGKFTLESSINILEKKIRENQQILEANGKKREELLKEYYSIQEEKTNVAAEQFIEPSEEDFICPTCQQDLPKENIDAKILEMGNNFQESKNTRLTNIERRLDANKNKGLSLKKETQTAEKSIKESTNELEQKRESLLKLARRINEIEKELQKPAEQPDYQKHEEYTSLEKQIASLQTELEKPIEDTTAQLRQQKQEIQNKIDDCNTILGNRDRVAKDKKRLEELKAEEKKVAALISELEGHQFLMERFVVAKVNLLEDNIKKHFKYVEFKMFEDNKSNEGITEHCETMVNTNGSSVPFSTNGNLGGKINAGLDIINTLCKHYNVKAPIFVDNRESVSKLIETNSQIINLVKPPSWDELDKSTQYAVAGVEEKEAPRDYTTQELLALESAKMAWNDRNRILRVEAVE